MTNKVALEKMVQGFSEWVGADSPPAETLSTMIWVLARDEGLWKQFKRCVIREGAEDKVAKDRIDRDALKEILSKSLRQGDKE